MVFFYYPFGNSVGLDLEQHESNVILFDLSEVAYSFTHLTKSSAHSLVDYIRYFDAFTYEMLNISDYAFLDSQSDV